LGPQQNTHNLDQALTSLQRASHDVPSMEHVLNQIIRELEALHPRVSRTAPPNAVNGA